MNCKKKNYKKEDKHINKEKDRKEKYEKERSKKKKEKDSKNNKDNKDNKNKKRKFSPKKKDPYEIKVGRAICPNCGDARSYTLHTRKLQAYNEEKGRNVPYLYAYGICNKCGAEIQTNKMKALNNKAIKAATKVPYDWKVHALEKIRKEQAEQSGEQ